MVSMNIGEVETSLTRYGNLSSSAHNFGVELTSGMASTSSFLSSASRVGSLVRKYVPQVSAWAVVSVPVPVISISLASRRGRHTGNEEKQRIGG
jgi:hypothetical protein